MEENKIIENFDDSSKFLLREIKTVKGILNYPQSISFSKKTGILLVFTDLHLYFIRLYNIFNGSKQLISHFLTTDILQMIQLNQNITDFIPTNFYRILSGVPEKQDSAKNLKRGKFDAEKHEKMIGQNKEFEKIPIFKQCKFQYKNSCTFIIGTLLNSGQIMIFKEKHMKNGISSIKNFENGYLNQEILKNFIENEQKIYSFCYSFDIKNQYIVTHFDSGIYIFEITKNTINQKARILLENIEKPYASTCMKIKLINKIIYIFIGLCTGNMLFSYINLDNFEIQPIQKIEIASKSKILYEPITCLKIINNFNIEKPMNLIISKTNLISEFYLTNTNSLEFIRNYEISMKNEIFGLCNQEKSMFLCTNSEKIYEFSNGVIKNEKSLFLLNEAFGIENSSNKLIQYIIGKGKLEKENKPIIEIFYNFDVTIPEIVIKLLKNAGNYIEKHKITIYEYFLEISDIWHFILVERKISFRDFLFTLINLQDELFSNLTNSKLKLSDQKYLDYTNQIKALFKEYNSKIIQILIAKIIYQLLSYHSKIIPSTKDSSINQLLENIEFILFKNYIQTPLSSENTGRLCALLYNNYPNLCLTKTEFSSEIIRILHNLPEQREKCIICHKNISVFSIKAKSIPLKILTPFPQTKIAEIKTVHCPTKHQNTVFLNTMKIRNVDEKIYQCSLCKIYQNVSRPCFMCNSFCYKLS